MACLETFGTDRRPPPKRFGSPESKESVSPCLRACVFRLTHSRYGSGTVLEAVRGRPWAPATLGVGADHMCAASEGGPRAQRVPNVPMYIVNRGQGLQAVFLKDRGAVLSSSAVPLHASEGEQGDSTESMRADGGDPEVKSKRPRPSKAKRNRFGRYLAKLEEEAKARPACVDANCADIPPQTEGNSADAAGIRQRFEAVAEAETMPK